MTWPPAPGAIGAVLAIVVLILAILGLVGVFPFTSQTVWGCLALLAFARLT
jgi:hypothetical protein